MPPWSAEDLEIVAHALNNRPRKILGRKTPSEVFEEQLRSRQKSGVDRPVESAQCALIQLTAHLVPGGIRPSTGSVGDVYHNALMETVSEVLETECIRPRSSMPTPTELSQTSSVQPQVGTTGA